MKPAFDSVRRARPLLGTFVEVTAAGAPRDRLHTAIDGAFEAVAEVHRLMSFHESGSDVSRLNRSALYRPVAVDAQTLEVLTWSRQFAEASEGSFDITVAAELVDWGVLPRPGGHHRPDGRGTWRDVELGSDGMVRFHWPLWIDLGGIAKGYAVDRAIERLCASGVTRGCVNAGGDLRALGATLVHLHPRNPRDRRVLVLDIANASVASSGGLCPRQRHSCAAGPHVHGMGRHPVGAGSFVSVVADRCVVADALTKVVLALGPRSDTLLKRYQATAHILDGHDEWRMLGAGAS